MRNKFDPDQYWPLLTPLIQDLAKADDLTEHAYAQIIKKYPYHDGQLFSKDQLIQAVRTLSDRGELSLDEKQLVAKIRMKPTRTQSGVAPITVLTKPFPCPGKCIFCPSDVRMPKSYLADEPGAQRAERNYFDPYLQTYNRLQALHNIGHDVEKAEIIILGGTWSYYPEKYQIWFVKECFRALNDFSRQHDQCAEIEKKYAQMNQQLAQQRKIELTTDPDHNQQQLTKKQEQVSGHQKSYNQVISEVYTAPEMRGGFHEYQQANWDELFTQQKQNEKARVRNVGLVIETRPDNISEEEVIRIRKLGCTKTQIGVQSLSDKVLDLNHRGHDVAATRRAFRLLRQAGFKIHAHWMANLYGSGVEKDKADYDLLFADQDFRPDELKIYPCSLIGSAELMDYYQAGKWRPFSQQELSEVLTHVMTHTPQYARLTRVIRDIPSTDIVEGNKLTNFRQIVESKLKKTGQKCEDIRAREIRQQQVTIADLKLDKILYDTTVSREYFLQYVTKKDNKIVGFLRLSLPKEENFIDELRNAAMIREVHVYGVLANIGSKDKEKSQHLGLGKDLIQKARQLAHQQGFEKLAVISAVGTREYYRKRGFSDGELYQFIQTT